MGRLRFAGAALLLAALPAGAQDIRNTASLSYPGAPAPLRSNTVTLAVEAAPAPVPADLLLAMTASVRGAAAGDRVSYRLHLTNRGAAAARGVHLVVTLPPGFRGPDGARTVDLPLGPVPVGATVAVPTTATVAAGAAPGEAVARGVARIRGAAASNEASAAVTITPFLFADAITILGEVRNGPCGTPGTGAAGVRLLTENGDFAVTDADGRYHFEGIKPGRHVVQLDPASLGGARPLLCADTTRAAGSGGSRFVEGAGGMVAHADFRLSPIAPAVAASPQAPVEHDWLAEATPGIALMYPTAQTNPRAPVTHIVVAHQPGQRIALQVGGHPVDPLSFDMTDIDAVRGVAVSRWSGIPLMPGVNPIVAFVLGADGRQIERIEGVVTLSGLPARATLDPERSRLIADGVHPARVAVRIVDGAGRPVRDGALVRVTVAAPYALAGDVALGRQRALAGQGRDTTVRVTGDDGIASIALASTARAGEVQLSVSAASDPAARPSVLHAWLDAAAAAWVVVGFAGGTVGHDILSRHRELAAGDEPVTDGRVAFYARGRIKGSWLLTIAYDSDRLRARDAPRGAIDPDRYYTVYGDASPQGQDAGGGGTLYVRVEAHAFYALFGDIETGFGDTRLLRYVRSVDGVKAAYADGAVRASGFVARPSSRHVRDEIRGAGITGPYRLSAHTLVPDSDALTLEVRDRDRAERVVARSPLARHVDYEIDDATGIVRLHAPLLSTDAARNPLFLIADYETEAPAGQTIAGARVAVGQGPVTVGVTAVRDAGAGDATILGVDVTARVAATTIVRAEAGAGGRGGLQAGHAWLVEVEHHDRRVDLLASAREQQAGFGLGQQNAGDAGTRKLGLDARLTLAPRNTLTASLSDEVKLDGSAERAQGTIALEQVRDHGTVSIGAELSHGRIDEGPAHQAARLKLGGSRAFASGALLVSGEAEIGSGGESAAYPLRQRIDVSYRVARALRLIAGYERSRAGGTLRGGIDLTPWPGISISALLNRSAGSEDGARLYAVYGIDQNLVFGRHWSVDATLDSSRAVGGAGPVMADPFGGGAGEDFVAATLGAAYRAAGWSWTGRVEYRGADRATRIGLTTGVVRTLGAGRTLGADLRAYRSTAADGNVARSIAADLALALRPPDSRWALLDRLEFRHQRGDVALAPGAPDADAEDDTRAINNLAVDFRSEREGEGFAASLYYGAKYARSGLTDVTGVSLRRDLASWLDIGVQASLQHGWLAGTLAYSAGPSIGISPARGLWISGGYNLVGFHDPDFTGGSYARRGAFLTLRSKFDQTSLGLAR